MFRKCPKLKFGYHLEYLDLLLKGFQEYSYQRHEGEGWDIRKKKKAVLDRLVQ